MNNILSLNNSNWEKIKTHAAEYKYIESLDDTADPFDESKWKLSGIISRIYYTFLACFGSEKGQLRYSKVTLQALRIKSSDFDNVCLEESIQNAKSMKELENLVNHATKLITEKQTIENAKITSLQEIQKLKDEIQTERSNLESDKNLLNNEKQKLENEIKDFHKLSTEKTKELAEAKNKLENEIEDFHKISTEKTKELAEAKTKLDDLLNKAIELNATKQKLIDGANTRYAIYEVQAGKNDVQKQKLKKKFNDKLVEANHKINELTADKEAANNEIAQLKEQLTKINEATVSQNNTPVPNEELKNANLQIEKLKKTIEKLKKEINTQKGLLGEAAADMAKLQDELVQFKKN